MKATANPMTNTLTIDGLPVHVLDARIHFDHGREWIMVANIGCNRVWLWDLASGRYLGYNPGDSAELIAALV